MCLRVVKLAGAFSVLTRPSSSRKIKSCSAGAPVRLTAQATKRRWNAFRVERGQDITAMIV